MASGYLLPVSNTTGVNDNLKILILPIFVKQYFYRDSQDEQTFFYFSNPLYNLKAPLPTACRSHKQLLHVLYYRFY
jgi:hypothetical protein